MGEEKNQSMEGQAEVQEGQAEKPLEKMTKEEVAEAFREQREKTDRNYDLYLRSMADVENIKKRAAKEKEEWVKYANESLIKSILPVIDNLEKAIVHSRDRNGQDSLREGVELTLKGLKESLGKSGVQEIAAQGAPFDPRYHEAVYEAEDDRTTAGTVVQELQRGYTFNGRLLRPAMVVVSSGRAKNRSKEDIEKREEIPRQGSL
jgi:molecular chaperone GrpE